MTTARGPNALVLDDSIKTRHGKKMPGVSSHFDLDAEKVGQAFFEGAVEAAGGEPAIEGGVDHVLNFRGADERAGGGTEVVAGVKGFGPSRCAASWGISSDMSFHRARS